MTNLAGLTSDGINYFFQLETLIHSKISDQTDTDNITDIQKIRYHGFYRRLKILIHFKVILNEYK